MKQGSGFAASEKTAQDWINNWQDKGRQNAVQAHPEACKCAGFFTYLQRTSSADSMGCDTQCEASHVMPRHVNQPQKAAANHRASDAGHDHKDGRQRRQPADFLGNTDGNSRRHALRSNSGKYLTRGSQKPWDQNGR